MKKYKFWIETGVVGADFYEINEVEDNVTEETLEEYMQIEEAKALVPIEIYKELDRHFDFEQFGLRNDIIDDLQLYDLVRAEFQRGEEKQ